MAAIRPVSAVFLILILAGSGAPDMHGQGGVLPKGNPAHVDQDKVTGPQAQMVHDKGCFEKFMRPIGGSAQFSDSAFYFLAQSTGFGKASDPQMPTVKHTLYRLKLGNSLGIAEPLLSLEHKSGVALAAYGSPIKAVAAVGFLGPKSLCFEGPAAVVNVTLAKKGSQAIRTTGSFSFVDTPDGRRLVDEKKHTLLEMDSETFQTKAARKLEKHERGLFYDPKTRAFTAWFDDGKIRGLVNYKNEDDSKPRRLTVNAEDRVVQRGSGFAVARLDAKANSITLQEIAEWTGVNSPGLHTIKLPSAYKVASAGLDVNFARRIAVIYAVGYSTQKQWQKVFVFDYEKGKVVDVMTSDAASIFHQVGLDPTGRFVVAEVRDHVTLRSRALKVLDLTKHTIQDVTLAAP